MSQVKRTILIGLLATATATGGCAVAGFWASVFAPPKTIQAKYELEPEGKVLVLVDDLGKPTGYEKIKRLLTEKVNLLLLDNGAADKVVSYEDIFRLAASRPDFNRMGISNVAKKLGANQIIYVHLDEFSLKDDSNISLWHGKLGVLVRVVDASGKTQWPADRPSGHKPGTSETPEIDNTSATYGATVAAQLADDMALKIARLFYKHTLPR